MLGAIGDAAAALETTRADELVVAIPGAPASQLEALDRACHAAGVPHRILRERPRTAPAPTQTVAE